MAMVIVTQNLFSLAVGDLSRCLLLLVTAAAMATIMNENSQRQWRPAIALRDDLESPPSCTKSLHDPEYDILAVSGFSGYR